MEYVEERRAAVEDHLRATLSRVEPAALRESLEHVTFAGGKRVRPTVTVLCCEAAGGEVWTGGTPESTLAPAGERALDFAVGIELVHSASLVVDDIIDRSELRRGEQSAWAAFGYGDAIVASDGLLGEAFALFDADPRATTTVADAMIELGQGEASELVAKPESEEAYLRLARRKTGALFRAAAELGAIAADADDEVVAAFGEYAERVGVAFQIRDDVLDATGDAERLGKPAGVDDEMDRPSVLRVTGRSVEEVNALADEQRDAALAALDRIDGPTGHARDYLDDLAVFVVERER
ncbi:polyprenyl synthetase family protein [Halocalculus aciditolerans]|uniref:Isopentenyl pyrophosphate isomerase n=1 Tax=Halocalculus aciditolerans TaxID=1383812 RepID=A0A830F896_9EURY|nr:polyprenyl synthetase family protein [Halocalculus aciditolerans]GGL49206.1 isopentenyl pyrophosphate isomerase [Halocalculus aciditolerans]